MAKVNVAQIPAKLYGLLEPLSPDERTRAVQATMILFGAQASTPPNKSAEVGTERTGEKPGDPSSFFKEKNPENKGEILAVAARYRERQGHREKDPRSHSVRSWRLKQTNPRRNSRLSRDPVCTRQRARIMRSSPNDTNRLPHERAEKQPDRRTSPGEHLGDRAGRLRSYQQGNLCT